MVIKIYHLFWVSSSWFQPFIHTHWLVSIELRAFCIYNSFLIKHSLVCSCWLLFKVHTLRYGECFYLMDVPLHRWWFCKRDGISFAVPTASQPVLMCQSNLSFLNLWGLVYVLHKFKPCSFQEKLYDRFFSSWKWVFFLEVDFPRWGFAVDICILIFFHCEVVS